MTFKKVPGLKGRLYIPEKKDGKTGKHNCIDCFSCQMCSDVRCESCLGEQEGQCGKQEVLLTNSIQDRK